MSGPKITRVITKRERMLTCRRQMDALRSAIDEWRNCAVQHDAPTEQIDREIETQFKYISTMYDREQFRNVEKHCTDAITFLENEKNQIQEQAMAEAERDRSLRRRLQYSAETLVRAFGSSGRMIPEELQHIATSAITIDATELQAMSTNLNRLLTEFTTCGADTQNMTPLQKELSKTLAEGEKLQTLAEWQTSQSEFTHIVEKECRLDKLLAEIQAFENTTVMKPFLDRTSLIAQEPSPRLRSLLTDSLIFDLISHSKARKEKESTLTSMREVCSELKRLSSKAADNLRIALSKAIDSEDLAKGSLLRDKGAALIRDTNKVIAGAARREAILKGLSEIGYEVRENMATAWAEDGRIVVKKPNEKGYGVELGSVADAEKFQIQLVSLEQSHEAAKLSRDRDRETIWCSEFSQLQTLLEKSGAELIIEKAIPSGIKPLKQVEAGTVIPSRERSLKEPTLRFRQHE